MMNGATQWAWERHQNEKTKMSDNQKVDWEKLFRSHPSVTSEPPEAQERLLDIIMPLFNESSRGAVLVGVARLDEALSELHIKSIELTVVNSKAIINDLFKPYGPLSSLAGKIQIAYAYGLIGADTHADLNRIRKIRNLAAHSDKEFSFESEEVRKRVSEITVLRRFPKGLLVKGKSEVQHSEKSFPKNEDDVKVHFVGCAMVIRNEILDSQVNLLLRHVKMMELISGKKPKPETEANPDKPG